MSSAFNTIKRGYLTAQYSFDKDVYRIIRVLLSNTALEIKLLNAKTSSFACNKTKRNGMQR